METKEKNKGGSRGLIYTTLSGTMKTIFNIFTHKTGCIVSKEERKRAKTKLPEPSSS